MSPTATVANLDPTKVRARVEGGALLLDVRELDEWQSGHVFGAMHLPLGELTKRAVELPREREIVVMCLSGGRSQVACEILARAGFGAVANATGGITAWVRAGLPTARS
jgi:rhodanese-related sulfurtransferase